MEKRKQDRKFGENTVDKVLHFGRQSRRESPRTLNRLGSLTLIRAEPASGRGKRDRVWYNGTGEVPP